MSQSRPAYRELELPKIEARTRSGWGSALRWIVLAAVLVALAIVAWKGELKRGLVYAKEWVDRRLGPGAAAAAGAADASRLMVHVAQPIDLRITAKVSGTLESASSATVYSEVEGENAILKVLPVGTRVAAGDVVVELDSSLLRAREDDQEIVVENARAAAEQLEQANQIAKSQAEGNLAAARLVVEFARLDLEKYEKGDYPLELRQLQIDTALAQEELERAKVQVAFSESLAKDGYIHQGELDADRSRVKQAEYKLENARGRERSLQDYSYPRMKRDLESKVEEAERALGRVETQERLAAEQAATNAAAKQKTLALEQAKLQKVRDQLDKCSIRAPQAGMVIYPVPTDPDQVDAFIRQGNRVKERQLVFSIPDSDLLQVTGSVHEAIVNRIKKGLPARVTIDPLPELVLSGTVEWVSPTPDPDDWRRTTVKFYETKVRLEGATEGLLPGMSAKLEILIEDRPDTLAVPVEAVVQRGTKGVCYVLGAQPELRRLTLGKSNATYIEVLEGLTAGERVVLGPDVLGIPADAFQEAPPAQASTVAAATHVSAPPIDEPAPDPAASAEPEPVVQELEYEAALAGVPVTSAMAEFKIKTKDGVPAYKFKAKVAGGPPSASYDIKVDGVSIGSVALDETGTCSLELSTKLGNFPPNFPLQAGPGSTVELGADLKGTLAPVTP